MKRAFIVVLVALFTPFSFAGNTHACKGKVVSIVTRASFEDTQVVIEGLSGAARLGYGGDQYRHLHERQFATLLAAYMAEKPVILEFLDSTGTCSDDHNGTLIRYVALS